MPLPKLTPLQSRVVASVAASAILLLLYLILAAPRLAYAADVDQLISEDHNHERLAGPYLLEDDFDGFEAEEDTLYESDFLGLDRSIVGRTPDGEPTALVNNVPAVINVPQGTTVYYYFKNSSLWAEYTPKSSGLPSPVKREDGGSNETGASEEEDSELTGELRLKSREESSGGNRTLWITLNTCLQPSSNTTSDPPAQLEMYVSTTSKNTKPGPEKNANQVKIFADGGWALYQLNATGDVYIGVHGPNNTGYENVYSMSLAASIDAPFHDYNSTPNLYFVDSDSSSALLITDNLTTYASGTVYDEWMNISPPFVMFANNQNDSSIKGVQNSFCGLENYAQIAATQEGVRTDMVQTGMTNRGIGRLPKQQFYFSGLNGSSSYFGILAMYGNSTNAGAGVPGGGGKIYKSMNFSTLSDGNCDVIFNLSFCDQVAYAVPSNPQNYPDVTSLAAFYDNATQASYKYFDYALQQIPCNTTASAQYSLVRTCDDCADAYKNWLCSVMIPRCTDFSSTEPWKQERNVQQPFPNGTMLDADIISAAGPYTWATGSRNPNIDTQVAPGPYKEVLPCADLCYNIVQSCPAALGFGCPEPGALGFNRSYGQRPNGSADQLGQITCNYPGAAYFLSGGYTGAAWSVWSLVVVVAVGFSFV